MVLRSAISYFVSLVVALFSIPIIARLFGVPTTDLSFWSGHSAEGQ